MIRALLITMTLVVQVAPAARPGPTLQTRLQSADVQVRMDAFYEVLGEPSQRTRAGDLVLGKTPAEICGLLGTPTHTILEEYPDCTLLEAFYLFDGVPTQVPERDEMLEQGWRYCPEVHFRNGVSVSATDYYEARRRALLGLETTWPTVQARRRMLPDFPCRQGAMGQ